jgi:hypothetical protein
MAPTELSLIAAFWTRSRHRSSKAAAGLEDSLWLCPIEDRRGLDSAREGMMQRFSLGSYVQVLDYTGRLFRQGKATISAELAGIFERVSWSAET